MGAVRTCVSLRGATNLESRSQFRCHCVGIGNTGGLPIVKTKVEGKAVSDVAIISCILSCSCDRTHMPLA